MKKVVVFLCIIILLGIASGCERKSVTRAPVVFAENLNEPEAPVLLPDGSWLVVEMGAEQGSITHISTDGKTRRIIAKTGRPNGLAVDKQGNIWVAESMNPPSLLKVTMDGKVEVFLKEYRGDPFLFPNDLAFGPDGSLYMTDSGVGFDDLVRDGKLRADYRDIKTDGSVFRIDLHTKTIEKIDSGLKFANGIAFSPDNTLYVAEMFTGNVYRYRRADGKGEARRELFGSVFDGERPAVFNGPDGMKFGQDGNLYVTVYGQGVVTVLRSDGSILRHIPTPGSKPTNVAFGAAGEEKIYVTEDETGVLLAIEVDTPGLPLYQ
ncbi:MAG: SMP-30/gluconolactonase/LRE family protein [Nitrospirota bacterium]